MFLSKLMLDHRHPQARRDLSSPYEMHRTLSRAFAPDAQSRPARFLWRLEHSRDSACFATILVQSDIAADWSVLALMSGYAPDVLGNKPVDLGRLIDKPGARFRFRLLANPTVTRDGKRHGLTKEEDQLDWLSRQGAHYGFGLNACVRLSNERIEPRHASTGRRMTLQSVLLEGALEAQDVAGLRAAVRTGLGHGKALGLGLLSLARIAGLDHNSDHAGAPTA
jgi:CRISPR system Cascade subunit CasE